MDPERRYVDLIFRSSKKYASWDPEINIEAGDYGRITQGKKSFWAFWRKEPRGTFLKEGNIYKNGLAEQYSIDPPVEHGTDGEAGDGQTWITSQNATKVDFDAEVGATTPAMVNCKAKAAFKFSSGHGAIIVMDNDTISTIEPPGSLRRLYDDSSMQGCVIVSQAHKCSSYARLLTAEESCAVGIGLTVEPPAGAVASASVNSHWERSSTSGNFKSKVNKTGKREYCPLFKLVSLKENPNGVSSGLRGGLDDLEEEPLPDALPPWIAAEENETKETAKESTEAPANQEASKDGGKDGEPAKESAKQSAKGKRKSFRLSVFSGKPSPRASVDGAGE